MKRLALILPALALAIGFVLGSSTAWGDQLPVPTTDGAYAVCAADVWQGGGVLASCQYAQVSGMVPVHVGLALHAHSDADPADFFYNRFCNGYGGSTAQFGASMLDQATTNTMIEGTAPQGGAGSFQCWYNGSGFDGGLLVDADAANYSEWHDLHYAGDGKAQYVLYCPPTVTTYSNAGSCVAYPAKVFYRTMPDTSADQTAMQAAGYPSYPFDYFPGGSAGQNLRASTPPGSITAVTGDFGDHPKSGQTYHVIVTYTGNCPKLVFDPGNGPTGYEYLFNPPSPTDQWAVTWATSGDKSAQLWCENTAGVKGNIWVFGAHVIDSNNPDDCIPSGWDLLSPTAYVRATGCLFSWAFVPKRSTIDDLTQYSSTTFPFSWFSATLDAGTTMAGDVTDNLGHSCGPSISTGPVAGTPGIGLKVPTPSSSGCPGNGPGGARTTGDDRAGDLYGFRVPFRTMGSLALMLGLVGRFLSILPVAPDAATVTQQGIQSNVSSQLGSIYGDE